MEIHRCIATMCVANISHYKKVAFKHAFNQIWKILTTNISDILIANPKILCLRLSHGYQNEYKVLVLISIRMS
jgi:hypothetical protein